MPTSSDKIKFMLSQLRLDFLDTLANRCFELETSILDLAGKDKHCIEFEAVFRTLHSLKGGGGTHGLPVVSSICHYFEDLLTDFGEHSFDDGFINLALRLIDLLKQVVEMGAEDSPTVLQSIEAEFASIKKADDQLPSVLVLEPSKMVSLLLQSVLTDLDLKPIILRDSMIALQRLLHEPFNLIIVSLELNLLNGLALVSALQVNKGLNAKTPVVLLTSQRNYCPDFLENTMVLTRSPVLEAELRLIAQSLFANHDAKKSPL